MPSISVVIPTFGRPALLQRAIASVLAQTLDDIEVIVVIDGHDPDTLEGLRTITDSRVRHVAHGARQGAGVARNTGADAARGRWVAFLDDDDEWRPTKLERQLAIAPQDDRAVLMTLSHVVTPYASFVRPAAAYDGKVPVDEWLFDRTTWAKGGLNFFQTSSLMVPEAMFRSLRFRAIRQHEDWELLVRAVKELGYPLLTVEEPLVIHYLGFGRPSLSSARTAEDSLRWIGELGDLVTPRAFSGFVLNSVGLSAANAGEYRLLLPLLAMAFRKGRPSARQLFRYAMSWLLPRSLRYRVRALLQGGKAPPGARTE